jgi:hypothetical protein
MGARGRAALLAHVPMVEPGRRRGPGRLRRGGRAPLTRVEPLAVGALAGVAAEFFLDPSLAGDGAARRGTGPEASSAPAGAAGSDLAERTRVAGPSNPRLTASVREKERAWAPTTRSSPLR